MQLKTKQTEQKTKRHYRRYLSSPRIHFKALFRQYSRNYFLKFETEKNGKSAERRTRPMSELRDTSKMQRRKYLKIRLSLLNIRRDI